ncbi:MAG: hypothetical protein LBS17_00095, partial [Actinomycetes bacterium]|nr:hypothetical protein [Actinomycetes bacterium]
MSLVVVAVFGVVSAAGAADSDFINPINVGSLPYVVNDTIGAGDTARFYRDVGGSPQTISGKTYAVQLTAGTPYVFRLESTDDYFDPYLYLNSSSDLVTYNDDDGVELNSRIIYTPTVSG